MLMWHIQSSGSSSVVDTVVPVNVEVVAVIGSVVVTGVSVLVPQQHGEGLHRWTHPHVL